MVLSLTSIFRAQTKPNNNQTSNAKVQTPKIANQKPVLISLDVDGTLLPWRPNSTDYDQTAFLRYQHTLQEPTLKKDSFIILNTGRGLKATRQLAPILGRFPFDALGINDGQQLFIKPTLNPKLHPSEANQQWIQQLNFKQQDPSWKKELKSWSTTQVLKDIKELISSMGYEPVSEPNSMNPQLKSSTSVFIKQASIWNNPKHGYWMVRMEPDQAYLEVKRIGKIASAEETAHYAETLGRVLKYHLKDEWPGFSVQVNATPDRCFLHIGPKNNSKASLVSYVANHRLENKPKAIISAGDNTNDLPLLSANHLAEIPNYPVVVGDNKNVIEALRKKAPSFVEYVGWNQLHTGIEKQFQKIRPLLPAKTPTIQSEQPIARLDRVG